MTSAPSQHQWQQQCHPGHAAAVGVSASVPAQSPCHHSQPAHCPPRTAQCNYGQQSLRQAAPQSQWDIHGLAHSRELTLGSWQGSPHHMVRHLTCSGSSQPQLRGRAQLMFSFQACSLPWTGCSTKPCTLSCPTGAGKAGKEGSEVCWVYGKQLLVFASSGTRATADYAMQIN